MEYLFEKVTKLDHRGEFVTPEHFRKILPFDGDLYRSYYGYDKSILEHLESGKGIKDFRGVRMLPEIILDYDGHDNNLAEAFQQVQQAAYTMMHGHDVEEHNLLVWFSGGGFHMVLPTGLFGEGFDPSPDLPRIVRNTLLVLFPQADNIYDHARVIRVPYSFNSKRGRWKVPIPYNLLHSLDLDKVIHMSEKAEWESVGYTRKVEKPVLEEYVKPIVEAMPPSERMPLNNGRELTNVVTCMHTLYLRGPVKGRRHQDLLRMISHWRRQHMPFEVCVDGARTWLENGGLPMPDNEVLKIANDVFDKDYRYGCNDNVRVEFCDSRCIFFAQKNEGGEISSTESYSKKFQHMVEAGRYSKPFDLNNYYNLGRPFSIYPGELVTVIGDTGTNKTALLQNLAVLARPRRVLYVSTEMSQGLLFRRFVQIASGLTKNEVLGYYERGQEPPGLNYIDHIRLTDEQINVKMLYKHLLEVKPEILMIDVIEDIGDDQNMNVRIDQAAIGLSNFARKLNMIVIGINHIRKEGMTGRLTLQNSKGPKSLVDKSDKVLILEGKREEIERRWRTDKARDEAPFNIQLKLDRETFRMNYYGT